MIQCKKCRKEALTVQFLNSFENQVCAVCIIGKDHQAIDKLSKDALFYMERQQHTEVKNLLNQMVDIAIARNKPVALARLYLFLASTYANEGNRRMYNKYIDLSAELGNPEAQYTKGNQLISYNSDLALDFLLKSAEQKVKVL